MNIEHPTTPWRGWMFDVQRWTFDVRRYPLDTSPYGINATWEQLQNNLALMGQEVTVLKSILHSTFAEQIPLTPQLL